MRKTKVSYRKLNHSFSIAACVKSGSQNRIHSENLTSGGFLEINFTSSFIASEYKNELFIKIAGILKIFSILK